MYLPKSQYIIKKAKDLSGVTGLIDELGNSINDNKEIVITSFGSIFEKAGIDFNKGDFSKAKKLLISGDPEQAESRNSSGYDFEIGNTPELSSSSAIKSIKLKPTSKEKKEGFKKRFLYKNKSTGKIKELLKPVALRLLQVRKPYELILSFNWLIEGPAEDQMINGFFLEGIKSKNQKTLDSLEKVMSGVSAIIRDPLEFVTDTLPVTEKTAIRQEASFDIPAPGRSITIAKSMHEKYPSKTNSVKGKENLLAKSGQFLIEGTNRPYVGLYHVHPTKGPMVGATHVKSRHSRLVAQNNYRSSQGTTGIQGITGGNSSPSSTSTSGGGGSYSGGSPSGGSPSGGYGGY